MVKALYSRTPRHRGWRYTFSTNERVEFNPGYCLPLAIIPPATKIHAIELHPGRGAQIARSAGQSAQLVSVDGDRATVKMPSGEIRFSTLVAAQRSEKLVTSSTTTKALKSRSQPLVGPSSSRSWCCYEPVDHPMGGGEGRTSGAVTHNRLGGNSRRASQLAKSPIRPIRRLFVATAAN